MRKTNSGFTIVELLIVIVVIAILAAISIVAYNGIQGRARIAAMRSDISSINKAILIYYAENGSYPITPATAGSHCSGSWCGFDQATGDNFIPGLSPKYIATIPQLPAANTSNDTYLYRSPDGSDYKLIRYMGVGLSTSENTAMADLMTTTCGSGIDSTRWGYWSSNNSRCW